MRTEAEGRGHHEIGCIKAACDYVGLHVHEIKTIFTAQLTSWRVPGSYDTAAILYLRYGNMIIDCNSQLHCIHRDPVARPGVQRYLHDGTCCHELGESSACEVRTSSMGCQNSASTLIHAVNTTTNVVCQEWSESLIWWSDFPSPPNEPTFASRSSVQRSRSLVRQFLSDTL